MRDNTSTRLCTPGARSKFNDLRSVDPSPNGQPSSPSTSSSKTSASRWSQTKPRRSSLDPTNAPTILSNTSKASALSSCSRDSRQFAAATTPLRFFSYDTHHRPCPAASQQQEQNSPNRTLRDHAARSKAEQRIKSRPWHHQFLHSSFPRFFFLTTMRLLFTLVSFAIAICGTSASFDPRTIDPNHNPTLALERRASIINAGDCYGAPIPPWEPHSQPGWYYGPCAYAPDGLLCLADSLVCLILDGILGLGFPFCPPYAPPNTPPGDTCGCSGSQGGGRSGGSSGGSQPQIPPPPAGYSYTFENLTCAAVGCPSYLTYGMVTNATGCAMMCDQTPKCIAANYYEDRNSSKPAGMLTCALFNQTRTQSDATNCGGQEQLLPKSNVTDQILYSYAIVKNSAKSG